jgi:hypothetical protein
MTAESNSASSGPTASPKQDGHREACKTYIEQTKLLVTLSSAFVLSPIAVLSYLRNDKGVIVLTPSELHALLWPEGLFVLSVLLGYVVLGSLAGTQHDGEFNVYRVAIRVFSLLQFFSYLFGLAGLAWLLTAWVKP